MGNNYFARNGTVPYSPPSLTGAGNNRSSQGNGLLGVSNPFFKPAASGLIPTQRVGAAETTGFDPTNPSSAVAGLGFKGGPVAQNYNNAGGTFSLMA